MCLRAHLVFFAVTLRWEFGRTRCVQHLQTEACVRGRVVVGTTLHLHAVAESHPGLETSSRVGEQSHLNTTARIVILDEGLARADRNEAQIPNVRGVRVHVSTGYHRVEGTRRVSVNGRVSDISIPPEIASVTSHFLFSVGGLRG